MKEELNSNNTESSSYSYQVGGSLPLFAPSYVKRRADEELFKYLRSGELCYVLNSRQMGKSSLRVQTMQRLQAESIACSVIDITSIGTQQITPEQWYASFIASLVSSFRLPINLRTWWREREHFSCIKRLSDFFETVLLAEVSQNIVIFIDEIDSVLGLKFPIDDFFAWIRSCYNKRAEQPDYRRLTFALIGVATPTNLISDKNRTPFNIGKAIQLNGFELHETQPLLQGLEGKISHPQQVLAEVLAWTGGQPFLTQKLCNLLVQEEATSLAHLVRKRVIENWESQDEPEHLKTIRDRLLRNEKRAGRLLGLYQQILEQGEIASDDSSEQMELRLSGLVVNQQNHLRVANRIYREVFNLNWVERELGKLRPYADAFQAWLASNYQDESRLLRGQALQDALAWAGTKSLSNQDYHFLNASQRVEQREAQKAFELERQARKLEKLESQIALDAERKVRIEAELAQEKKVRKLAELRNRIALISSLVVTVISIVAVIQWQAAEKGKINAQLNNLALFSENLSAANQELDALIIAIKAGKQLNKSGLEIDTKNLVLTALQQVIHEIKERNRWVGHSDGITSVSFSPDGKTIASASADKTIKLWNLQGQELATFKGHGDFVWGVSFSPDGKTIASASADKTIKLWNLQGQELATFKGHRDVVNSVSFSPDGKIIASASADRTIKLWNLQGQELAIFKGHRDGVLSVSFSPDGKTIASASADKTIKLWNLQGKELATLKGHSDVVNSVSFSPEGKTITSASYDNTIKLWNLQGKELATFKGHRQWIYGVSFSPDGKTIASASLDRTIRLWNLQGKELTTLKGHSDGVLNVSFSRDGKTLASGSGLGDRTIRLWNVQGQELTTLKGHSHWVISVNFSPNGQTLASASNDSTIKLWNLQGQQLATLKGHKYGNGVWDVNFSPDGKIIASASADNTIKLWNLQGQQLATLKGHRGAIRSVSFSPDGQTIASASFDKTIKLWNLEGKELATFKGHRDAVNSVSFSPDGLIIASASYDNTIKIWNLEGKELATFKGHTDGVLSVRFSPDGQTLASASNDRTIKLWNLQGQELATLKGHSSWVADVNFSPDGKTIASASADNTIKLWNLQGQELATLKGHLDRVINVSFSPDGKTIASASADNTIKLWHLDLDVLLGQGCDWVRDYLRTNAEVNQSDRHLCDGIPAK